MQGPSYICGKYWDWIEPHVTEHLKIPNDIKPVENRPKFERMKLAIDNIK
jgi:hypothetical protein